jgi:capsular polysaccharide biosynthesis protein
MKNIPQTSDFPVSQKIYGRLLLAYPRAHRAGYGAAMAQLFRDLCLDAWNESRAWGLLKLWLRVLPDLVSTSILERLAALKERKSMTDKLANLFSFRTTPVITFFRVFVPVFILVFGVSVVITFILPETYASTARVMTDSDTSSECNVIRSDAVLGLAIDKLELNAAWGRKYNAGKNLNPKDTLMLLKARLNVIPEATRLIDITVYSEDRIDAARIANAIADSYRNHALSADNSATPAPNLTIVDIARPGHAPVRPNKILNLFVGAVAGILLGSFIGGIIAGVASLSGRKNAKA